MMKLARFDDRSKLLLGDDFELIKNFKIAVIGIGGVGSIVPISLVRSGVKNILIVDGDKVDETNLNRQIAYDSNDLNTFKVDALKNKLLNIRDDINISTIARRIDDSFDLSILKDYDFVIDCIDDVKAKILLAKFTSENNIPFISSMGTGNRLDTTKIIVTTLNKTSGDPLARKLRYELKKEDINLSKINVVFSLEEPIIKGKVISSMIFVPNTVGLTIASFVIKSLLGRS